MRAKTRLIRRTRCRATGLSSSRGNRKTFLMTKGKRGWQMSHLQKKPAAAPAHRLPPHEDLGKLFNIDMAK